MKIAFITYENFQQDYGDSAFASKACLQLTESDNLLRKFLEKNNIECEAVAWDKDQFYVTDFDMFLIRSAWNYYYSSSHFESFLRFIHKVRERVYNPAVAIKWNSNKNYLTDLEREGIPIIPTLFLKNANDLTLENVSKMEERTENFVIKPCISGAGKNTFKVNLKNNNQLNKIKESLLKTSIDGIMIQPFINSILKIGELSFVFFGDKFSHTVQRIPTKKFCNHEGGTRISTFPSEALIVAKNALSATYQILKLSKGSLLYARIDILFDKKRGYLVSEVELIEPELFLQCGEECVEKFGTVIMGALKEIKN